MASRLDDLVADHRSRRSTTASAWSESDAWLISYPDQFSDHGRPTLLVLGEVVESCLAPTITGIHVLPVHPWSSDGGFSVIDHSSIADGLGDWDDFSDITRRFDVMADAVVNHTSASGDWFRGFLARDPEYLGWFKTVAEGDDLGPVIRPRSTPLSTRFRSDDGTDVDVWTTFGPDQVDLDYSNPDVLLAVFEMVFGFVSRGAAAVRLDAVAFLWKQEGTRSIHLPETHTIVALLRSCLAEIDPDVMLVTETNVAHDDNVAYLGTVDRPEADAVYQFALPPLVLHAISTGQTRPLADWASALGTTRPGTTFMNFLAGHDGIGLRPARDLISESGIDRLCEMCVDSGGVVNRADCASGGTEPYELASTWFDLCAHGVSVDEAIGRHLATHAVMLALRGIPLLWIHSLVGSPNDTATFEATGCGRDLNRERFEASEFCAGFADPESRQSRVWSGMRRMLGYRRRSEAFHPDSAQIVHPCPDGLFVVERRSTAGVGALVVVNLGGVRAEFDLSPGAWFDSRSGAGMSGSITVDAWESVWMHDTERRFRS